jgi:hypothetical protein
VRYGRDVSETGDLLELLHLAGSRYRTLRAEFDTCVRPDVLHRAGAAAFARGPRRTRTRRSGSSSGVLSSGAPEDETEPQRGWLRVWVERPDRFREESGDEDEAGTLVRDGQLWWDEDPFRGISTNADDDEPAMSISYGESEILLDPAGLSGLVILGPRGSAERAGRRVLRAHAVPRAGLRGERGPSPIWMCGDDFEFEVDAEKGVLLYVEARFEGTAFSTIAATFVAYDEQIAPETFVFER